MRSCKKILIDGTVLAYPHTGVAKTLLKLFDAVKKERDIKLIWFTNQYKLPIKWISLFVLSVIHRPDYIHFHWGRIPSALPCKKVLMLHDIIPILMGENDTRIKNDVKRADIILTCSEYSKITIKQHLGVDATVIRHGA